MERKAPSHIAVSSVVASNVVVINPGSTSTKFALYAGDQPVFTQTLRHSDEEMACFKGRAILEQSDFRRRLIEAELEQRGFKLSQIDAVAGRGGLLKPLASGTYRVNDVMLEELRRAERGEHASNLGAVIAKGIADDAGVDAYVVDPVSVDEWPEKARLSGSAQLERQCLSHALNTKAVAKRYARERGVAYSALRLVVAHVGSGISVSAHEDGRMIDVTNSREEGAFSTERAGTVPAMKLVELCFSGKHTYKQIEAMLFREGGFYSYLGTKDLVEVERRISAGGEHAELVFDAMVYQIAKEIGAMSAALRGRLDAILLTGGMAHSEKLVAALKAHVEWIAPVLVYPGEDELQALAEGVLRVLRGEEAGHEYGSQVAAIVTL
ncbi:MAG TPA: butyrate kinase [Clostridia bacterium]|nr:butyrate kinase [Clostridia bacterium]